MSLLEQLAATSWFWTFSLGFLVSIVTSTALLFCSTLWWTIPLYAVWIWYDRKTSERGGRPIQWVREWSWWRYTNDYFKHQLVTNRGVTLDPNRNYIFACYPHGIFPVGPFASFVHGYQKIFPNHRAFTTALNIQFFLPVIRELFLAIGAVSVSASSLKYLLRNPTGGNIVSILIGGADEAKYSRPGKYKIILNKRKGFVKMALQMGSPVVPVITFGEPDVFDQLNFPGFGFVRDLVKMTLQIGLVIPKGTWLVCPNRVPLATVVGTPLDVEKIENPTNEQVEQLHAEFVENIKKLFDDHKHKYVKNPTDTILEIV